MYYNGQIEDYYGQFYEPYDHYGAPILGIPGNHDGDPAGPPQVSLDGWVRYFMTPETRINPESHDAPRSTLSLPNPYFTLNCPLAVIVGMYSNVPEGGSIDSVQQQWLTNEFATAPKDKALIVAVHHPVYSFDDHHSGSARMADALQQAINDSRRVPNLVLAAHVHNYQRIEREIVPGVQTPFLVAGNGGYPHRHPDPRRRHVAGSGGGLAYRRGQGSAPSKLRRYRGRGTGEVHLPRPRCKNRAWPHQGGHPPPWNRLRAWLRFQLQLLRGLAHPARLAPFTLQVCCLVEYRLPFASFRAQWGSAFFGGPAVPALASTPPFTKGVRMLTLEMMKARWPRGNQHVPGLLEGIVSAAPTVFKEYGLTTPLLVAHAMGQFSEECGQGLEMQENLNYSAQMLVKVFPSHFTPSMAQHWAHNPEAIGEIAYGGRLGNAPPPSTDGYVFRGAGLSQLTARANFSKLQTLLHKNGAAFDIVESSAAITDPAHALECGVADWVMCGCLPLAGKDDIQGETKALNGGLNGLAERSRQIALWKASLGVTDSTKV